MKMIKYKKVLSVVLASLLAGSTLAACSGGGKDKGKDGGKSSGPVEFTVMSPIWGDHKESLNDKNSNDVLDELMKNGNAKITYDFYPADQYANRVTTTLQSGDIPEVINGAMSLLTKEDAAIPLDDLFKEHAPNILKVLDDEEIEVGKLRSLEDGKTYAIPFALKYPQAYAWSIRTDWLKNVGIEKKPETWDEWLEVWEAFRTKDPNGDGNKDNDIPFSGDIYSLMPVFGMNVKNKNGFMVDENNQYILAPDHKNFDAYMEAMRDMYSKGYLDPEFAQRGLYIDNIALSDAINAEVVGSTFTWAEITRTLTAESTSGARLEGVVPPTGPFGDCAIPTRGKLTATTSLTVSAKDKAADIVKYFDYVFSEEGTRISSFGIEGVHHDMVDGKAVLKPEFSASFKAARQAGLNFTPLAHNFDPTAYESIMFAGKNYEESEEPTKILYDALYAGEKHFTNMIHILPSPKYQEYSAELLPQLDNIMAECVIGTISLEEFHKKYDELKAAGLDEIIKDQNEIWQTMSKN